MADTSEPVATEAVDTSSTDQAPVEVSEDTSLEDIEVGIDELDDPEEQESQDTDDVEEETPEEKPEAKEPEEAEEQSEATEETEAKDEEGDQNTDPSDNPKTKEDYIRERIERREAKRLQDLKDQQAYLKEAEGDDEELTKRKDFVDRYNLHQERLNINEDRVQVGIDKAIASIDLFRNGTPEVKDELLKAVDDFERLFIVKDKQGRYVEVKEDVFAYLQDKADSIRRIQGVGERNAQESELKAKAKVLPTPSRTPKEPKTDQDIADFDRAWDV